MSDLSSNDDKDTSIGSTEMRALRRLAEPIGLQVLPQQNDLWASRYRFIEPIGRGGMGEVYLARDVLLDRLVALKVLRTTSEESFTDARRLLREARAAAQAEHPRIARIYDVGTSGEHAFIAMEYVRGQTLRAWMKARRPSAHEIITIVHQLLEGLEALHERGLAHRDLKPENVMVTPDGNLRILDLGVARRVAVPELVTGIDGDAAASLALGVGTPGYMAPEQWRQSDIDGRADIFATGVIAYELVTAHAPFWGSTMPEIRERTLHAEIAFEGECWTRLPVELKSAIEIALTRDREQRFQDVESMVAVLAPLLPPSLPPISSPRPVGDSVPAATTAWPGSLAASAVGMSVRVLAQKRPRWLAIGAVAFVAVGAATVWLGGQPALLPPPPGMVQLAGASYSMGLDSVELETECKKYPKGCPPTSRNESPPRKVTVGPFELDVHEVTNEQFALFLNQIGSLTNVIDDPEDHYPRFVRYNPRPHEDYLLYDLYPAFAGIERSEKRLLAAREGFERLPVTLVTWLGAHLYCKAFGKRLPTEGEWEWAARGPEKRPFPWGTESPRCAAVHVPSGQELALLDPERCENDRKMPFPVMTAAQDVTPDGIYDMGGNVFEWVDDEGVHLNKNVTDATRGNVENSGLNRGGAFNWSFGVRTTWRAYWLANTPADNVGFRCAKSSVKK